MRAQLQLNSCDAQSALEGYALLRAYVCFLTVMRFTAEGVIKRKEEEYVVYHFTPFSGHPLSETQPSFIFIFATFTALFATRNVTYHMPASFFSSCARTRTYRAHKKYTNHHHHHSE